MRWLLWCDLLVVYRTGGLWAAASASVLVLAAFLLAWSDGVPVLDGTVLDQAIDVQTVLLAVLLPWTAARCGGPDRPADLVLIAQAAARRPRVIVTARSLAIAAGLACVVLAGVPVLLLAQQVSALEAFRLEALVPLLALCGIVAVLTAAAMLTPWSRVTRWLIVTAVTLMAVRLMPSGMASAGAFVVAAVAGAVVVGLMADARLRYLPEGFDG